MADHANYLPYVLPDSVHAHLRRGGPEIFAGFIYFWLE